MTRRLFRRIGQWACAGLLWGGLCQAAGAATGLDVLPGSGDWGPITVFYPSSAPAHPLQRGSFTLDVAWQGQAVAGNHRLVVVSHGSGGSPWPWADLADALVKAGFVVALPEHRGDNWHDHSLVGPPSWKIRPDEISAAIDRLAADTRFARLIDAQQVGVYGMSAGGLAALVMAGAHWSPARFAQHCNQHGSEDAVDCTGGWVRRDAWDPLKVLLARWYVDGRYSRDTTDQFHRDPRVRAVVAAVPMAAPVDLDSLRHRPNDAPALGLVEARRDEWLVPRFHIDPVRTACAEACDLIVDLPEGGHGAVLSPWSTARATAAGDPFLADPPSYQRNKDTPAALSRVVAYFQRHLLP